VETFIKGNLWLRAAVTAQVEVHECGLGLLRPSLNASHVCDESAAEDSMCTNVALCKAQIPLGSTRLDTFDVSSPCILAVSS